MVSDRHHSRLSLNHPCPLLGKSRKNPLPATKARVRVRPAATDGWRRRRGPRCRRGRSVRGSAELLQWFLGPARVRRAPRSDRARATSLRCVTTLALLGGGKMGEALLGGLIDGGWDPENLAVAEVVAERRHAIEGRFAKVRVVPNPAWAVAEAEVVVVAVKPGDVGRGPGRGRAGPRARGARPLDRRRRHHRHPGGPRPGPARGPGHAQHPGAGRAWGRRPSPPGATPARSTSPGRSRSSRWWGRWSGSPRRCSTPSPACPGPGRPTCSWWPRR